MIVYLQSAPRFILFYAYLLTLSLITRQSVVDYTRYHVILIHLTCPEKEIKHSILNIKCVIVFNIVFFSIYAENMPSGTEENKEPEDNNAMVDSFFQSVYWQQLSSGNGTQQFPGNRQKITNIFEQRTGRNPLAVNSKR